MKLSELLRERARVHYVDLSDPILTSLCRLVDAVEDSRTWSVSAEKYVGGTIIDQALTSLRKELEGEGAFK